MGSNILIADLSLTVDWTGFLMKLQQIWSQTMIHPRGKAPLDSQELCVQVGSYWSIGHIISWQAPSLEILSSYCKICKHKQPKELSFIW